MSTFLSGTQSLQTASGYSSGQRSARSSWQGARVGRFVHGSAWGKGSTERGEEEEKKEMRNLAEKRHCRQFCGQNPGDYMHLRDLQP